MLTVKLYSKLSPIYRFDIVYVCLFLVSNDKMDNRQDNFVNLYKGPASKRRVLTHFLDRLERRGRSGRTQGVR